MTLPSPLRVLLISPRARGGVGYTGEDAYTDGLLSAPPTGVEYVFYDDLIGSGEARRLRWVQQYVPRAARWAGGPLWVESLACDAPFDLVHIHGFSARLSGRIAQTPLVLTESSHDLENLIDYCGWSRAAVQRFARRKRLAFRTVGIIDQALNRGPARGLAVWSAWARELHVRWGTPESAVTVIPPYVPPVAIAKAKPANESPYFLFVGGDFERKNGPAVLEAFRRVQPRLPAGARLTMIGAPEGIESGLGIELHPRMDRSRLLSEFYPRANVLLLPSRAEGYGVAVVEAMSAGIVPIVSGFGVLPEIVGDAGIVCDVRGADAETPLAEAMLRLGVDAERRAALGARARERYAEGWTRAATVEALGAFYRQALTP